MAEAVAPMASDLLTDEERERFLSALRDGIGHGLAARVLERDDITGTKLRHCERRDSVFGEQVKRAMDEGREHYVERLSAQARLRALNGSDRMLEVELATHASGYEHLRRDRMTLDGKIEHGIVLSPGWLENAPTEVLEWLASMDADVIEDAEVIELPDVPELPA